MKKEPLKRMTQEEKESFDKLYNYLRYNILGYSKKQSLSKQTVLRLKGLKVNKFVENYKIEDGSDYSYDVILNTFKFCNAEIQKSLKRNTFNDESHKINYIFKIVESNLNNVYMRMENAKKANEKTKEIDMSTGLSYSNTSYKKKTEESSSRLNDLW